MVVYSHVQDPAISLDHIQRKISWKHTPPAQLIGTTTGNYECPTTAE